MRKKFIIMTCMAIYIAIFLFCAGMITGIIISNPGENRNKNISNAIETTNKVEATNVVETTSNLSNTPTQEPKIQKPKKTFEPKEYNISNGNYKCGIDFDEGTYNIIATSGSGNVICMENRLNTIMAVNEDSLHQTEYHNITFKKGNVLELLDIGVKLVKLDR